MKKHSYKFFSVLIGWALCAIMNMAYAGYLTITVSDAPVTVSKGHSANFSFTVTNSFSQSVYLNKFCLTPAPTSQGKYAFSISTAAKQTLAAGASITVNVTVTADADAQAASYSTNAFLVTLGNSGRVEAKKFTLQVQDSAPPFESTHVFSTNTDVGGMEVINYMRCVPQDDGETIVCGDLQNITDRVGGNTLIDFVVAGEALQYGLAVTSSAEGNALYRCDLNTAGNCNDYQPLVTVMEQNPVTFNNLGKSMAHGNTLYFTEYLNSNGTNRIVTCNVTNGECRAVYDFGNLGQVGRKLKAIIQDSATERFYVSVSDDSIWGTVYSCPNDLSPNHCSELSGFPNEYKNSTISSIAIKSTGTKQLFVVANMNKSLFQCDLNAEGTAATACTNSSPAGIMNDIRYHPTSNQLFIAFNEVGIKRCKLTADSKVDFDDCVQVSNFTDDDFNPETVEVVDLPQE